MGGAVATCPPGVRSGFSGIGGLLHRFSTGRLIHRLIIRRLIYWLGLSSDIRRHKITQPHRLLDHDIFDPF